MYEKILPRSQSDGSKTITGCVRSYNTIGKALFICKEHIMLLRPDSVINHWHMEQLQTGYINLTIKEFGLINTRAYISAIKSAFISQKCQLQLSSKLNKSNYSTASSCVTGIFKRHVNHVKNYTFKNLFTGKTETIHVTPNHLFYVKNRKRFIALNKITPTDKLLTLSGHEIRLFCPKGKKKHCGMRQKKDGISIIYNLEVSGGHEYFAGKNKIYVHNMYFCLRCEEKFQYSASLESHIAYAHEEIDNMAMRYKYHIPVEPQKQLQYNQLWSGRIQSILKSFPYQCPYCLHAFFSQRGYLAKHLLYMHSSRLSTYYSPIHIQSEAHLPALTPTGSNLLHLALQDWDKVLSETTFAMDEIAKNVQDLSEAYSRLEGYCPAVQSAMERDLAMEYSIPESKLPEISVQTAEQWAPSLN